MQKPSSTSYGLVALCVACECLSYCDRVNLSVAIVPLARLRGWSLAQRSYALGGFFPGYVMTQVAGSYFASQFGGPVVLLPGGGCPPEWATALPVPTEVMNRDHERARRHREGAAVVVSRRLRHAQRRRLWAERSTTNVDPIINLTPATTLDPDTVALLQTGTFEIPLGPDATLDLFHTPRTAG